MSGAHKAAIRIGLASMVGSAIEGFDFYAYGTAAALVFNRLFFPQFRPDIGMLAAFGTFAAGLFARPLGGVIFGYYGDRVGRKAILSLSLVLMGVATTLMGLLPTYEMVGISASIALIVLRIIQGLAFGGEMGGAMLMAVEHAPHRHKAFFGSFPQMGIPIGLLLATAAFALCSRLSEGHFLSWGWRLPFLSSLVLVVFGIFIRSRIEESPEFSAARLKNEIKKNPIIEVLKEHKRSLALTIGAKLGEVTLYFIVSVFLLSYATRRGFERADVLQAVMLGASLQLITIPICGWLGDMVGPKRLYAVGAAILTLSAPPMFLMMQDGSLPGFTIAVVIALGVVYPTMFGPQAAVFSAQFPAELRYTGLSLGVQIAAALGGGLAPIVASVLLAYDGTLVPVSIYLAVLGVIAAACTGLMRPI